MLLWLTATLEGKSRRGRVPDVKGGGWFVDPGAARARPRPRLCSCFWGDAEQPPSRVGPGLIYSRVSRAGEIELFDQLPDDPERCSSYTIARRTAVTAIATRNTMTRERPRHSAIAPAATPARVCQFAL